MRLSSNGSDVSSVISARAEAIADRVTVLYFEARPELEKQWKGARQKCTEDNRYHLRYLAEALSYGRQSMFTEYTIWATTLLASLNIPGEALSLNLTLLRTVLAAELAGEDSATALKYIDAALSTIAVGVPKPSSRIEGTGPLDLMALDYLAALLHGDRAAASSLVITALDGGTAIKDVYLKVFARSQQEVGRMWQTGQIGVAQEHYCTACTQLIMSQLYPRIFSNRKNGRRLVATCVGGDLHEMGVRMVADFFEMEGWDTFYLGANTPLSGTLQQVAERTPDVLAISATMSFHVQQVAELIAATRATVHPPHIMVGGAPFNSLDGLWKDVGADSYARDAADALAVAESWGP